jgi:two-component system sensor histidine kinase PrrB
MSMRINLDVLDGTPAPGESERAEIVADLRAEHERLLGLLIMLRALAQGELVEADAFTPVDLAELLDTAVADLRRAHPTARVTLDLAPGCVVHGWPQGLRSAVDNLLTNAVVHGAGPDGTAAVEVTVRRAAGPPAVEVLVDDHGPGVPEAARAQIFQRFVRRPDSPGSGLGLALVAQQAALHGGTITPTTRLVGGARLALHLPTPPARRE